MKKYLYILFVLVLSLFSCDTSRKAAITAQPQIVEKPITSLNKKAKNVIFMVGDGMGITQISSGLYSNDNKLNLERINTIGLHKCYSYDNLITDSAAGLQHLLVVLKLTMELLGLGQTQYLLKLF